MAFQINQLFRFWYFIILNTLSIPCSIFVLYHLLFDRSLRQALNNHVIIVILISNLILQLIDIPFLIHFSRVGTNWQFSIHFGQFWMLTDYLCYPMELILFSWATMERHILIFHDRWLLTKTKRFFLHYLPLIIILTYCFIYYLTIVVFLSCGNMSAASQINGLPIACTHANVSLALWDLFGNYICPTIITLIFSIGLIVRVLVRKSRLNQGIQWRKQRKMIIQILFITTVCQIFNFPWAFLAFCNTVKFPIDTDRTAYSVIFFFPYSFIFVCPFVCCAMLPKCGEKLKKLFLWRQQRRVIHPAIIIKNSIQVNGGLQKINIIH